MAQNFQPIVLRDVEFTLGDEAAGVMFNADLRSVQLTPDVNTDSTKGLKAGAVYNLVDDPTWSAEIGYLWGKNKDGTQTFADFCVENAGKLMPFDFRPKAGETDGWTGELWVVPGPLGGEQGSFSDQSVTMPIEGQPAKVPADAGTTTA